ncbi:MAG: precorrin-2 C(20)-methyltransferase [Tissierellia bacterium]|nr:precorrin-2 C(20)-methyltransferase [Tissierellia bacterium]MDD4726302.1 precorrin-2 C(20)-methyltransferase [Tissierellia bacterium]
MKRLYGIGTGPGASDLLTIRAVNAIRESQVIFTPNNKGVNMALDTAAEFIGNKRVVLIDFPMGKVTKEDYKKAAEIINNEIEEGETGSFLTIGDSMIYSTFIYIMDELDGKDIEIEIVPGIPSFVAAAAASKLPLTVKGDVFVLCDEYSDVKCNFDSIAILKTFKNKEYLLEKLEKDNIDYTYIKRSSLDNEEVIKDRNKITEDKDYISLILGRKK